MSFIIFTVLLLRTEYRGENIISYPVKLFLDIDPLIAFTHILATRAIQPALLFSFIVIVLSFFFGRFFCGWICPLGTLNEFVHTFSKKSDTLLIKKNIWSHHQNVKFYLLVFLVIVSLFSLQITGIVDPISLTIRSFSLSMLPVVNKIINATASVLYETHIPAISSVFEIFYSFAKMHILSFNQPYFHQSVIVGLIFLAILFTNIFLRRFWCRFLCPLGALFGLFSKMSILSLQQKQGCTACHRCVQVCQGASEPHIKTGWKPHECYVCGNCTSVCPEKVLTFTFKNPMKNIHTGTINLERRKLIAAFASGIFTVPLLKVGADDSVVNNMLVRPPGARAEKEFLRYCVRCGECMKVCITNGLHPTFLEAGIEGLWTPVFDFRMGYCEYNCTLCGQVCPTEAIKEISVAKKQNTSIGLACFDKSRCIPYVQGENCIVCEEHCPTPQKAIRFREVKVVTLEGKEKITKLPYIDPELCIGCGICEYKCPVSDVPAVRVTGTGASRHQINHI